jgi:hypothetical protein
MTDGVEVSSFSTVFTESGPLAVKAACAQAATDTTNNKERKNHYVKQSQNPEGLQIKWLGRGNWEGQRILF